MTIKFKPVGDRVLVKHDEEVVKRGSILIPDAVKEKPQTAVVVAVGCGKRLETDGSFYMPFKAGDRVLVSKFGGTDIKLDEKDFRIVNSDEVLGVFS
jgi:chaperonin GroES